MKEILAPRTRQSIVLGMLHICMPFTLVSKRRKIAQPAAVARASRQAHLPGSCRHSRKVYIEKPDTTSLLARRVAR